MVRVEPHQMSAACTVQQENPKKGVSAQRYESYKAATTLGQILDLGGSRGDIGNDLARSRAALEWRRLGARRGDTRPRAEAGARLHPDRGRGRRAGHPEHRERFREAPAAREPAGEAPRRARAGSAGFTGGVEVLPERFCSFLDARRGGSYAHNEWSRSVKVGRDAGNWPSLGARPGRSTSRRPSRQASISRVRPVHL